MRLYIKVFSLQVVFSMARQKAVLKILQRLVAVVAQTAKLKFLYQVTDHRIVLAGGDRQDHRVQSINLTLSTPPLNHVPKLRIYMSFKRLQGWCLNHLPGQPVPMLYNSFSEELFPNTQSKPSLAQLEAISPCPVACYLGEETNTHLTTTSFQVVVERS